jgi:hypothetical protein
VFVRFLEDNGLIDPPRLAGPGDRLARARDEHELYFRTHPKHSDREYLWSLFDQLAGLPGTRDVFGPHNPLRELPNWLSGDAAGELVKFFRKINVETGRVVHDFTDPAWDTRFLGDLYQDLSEAARKKYALLQTPDFVEEFILDRTLTPALDEFGLEAPAVLDPNGKPVTAPGFRMIDPACGSGHFLLGAFPRLLDRWQRRDPGTNVRELVQRTLDSICGVDVNPYAVAIARFRLLLAAMQACGIRRLADAPGFRLNLACGDSLLHAPLKSGQQVFDFERSNADVDCDHAYQSEDLQTLKRLLRGGQYHAVVANPPYILAKDASLNQRYRRRYSSCHMKYSLSVPFMHRLFGLAIQAGFTGQITANSFMKREFGKPLIELYLPTLDITHVIDCAGAHIPGHDTPTVILLGRHRTPIKSTLRLVMGIRGEPSSPINSACGIVWTSILDHIDRPGAANAYVSVADFPRERLRNHPWSIGGGGAIELKQSIEHASKEVVNDSLVAIGPMAITGAEECFVAPRHVWRKLRCASAPYVVGDQIRDWQIAKTEYVFYPYNETQGVELLNQCGFFSRLGWLNRELLKTRKMFGKTASAAGLKWYEYRYFEQNRAKQEELIAFAYVATHNHFARINERMITNRHATVMHLQSTVVPSKRFHLLGVLSSSLACFWMKQIFYPKATSTADISADKGKPEANRYEFSGAAMGKFPIISTQSNENIVTSIASISAMIDSLAKKAQSVGPECIIAHWVVTTGEDLNDLLVKASKDYHHSRSRMIALQEELDWECYRAYGLTLQGAAKEIVLDSENGVSPDARPFAWSDNSIPSSVPESWRQIYESRRIAIEESEQLSLIENAVHKRPWWGRQGIYGRLTRDYQGWISDALVNWLLDRVEQYFDFDGRMNDNGQPTARLDVALVSVARLADVARQDPEFQEVGALYRNDAAFDVEALVAELVAGESVPLLPVLRYKPSGRIKRQAWEQTWDLQRQEDAIDARTSLPASDPQFLSADAALRLKQEQVGTIAVPPKYDSKDFLSSDFWRLRGKLDVPKERWISFPRCEGADGTPVVAWAGYNHLQLAQSISGYFVEIQERLGGRDDPRLIPLLACLLELLPWLKQWHNEVDPEFGMAMGDYFEGFIAEEARQLGQTLPEIKAWTPPKKAPRAAQTAKAKKQPRKKSSTPEPEPQ